VKPLTFTVKSRVVVQKTPQTTAKRKGQETKSREADRRGEKGREERGKGTEEWKRGKVMCDEKCRKRKFDHFFILGLFYHFSPIMTKFGLRR